MAIYHATVSPVSRAAGHSAVAAAAYDARTRLRDERTGELHDHRKTHSREEVVADFGISFPDVPGGIPDEWHDRFVYWNAVEKAEKSAKAQVASRIEFAMPDELSESGRRDLVGQIIQDFTDAGLTVDVVTHRNRDGGEPGKHWNNHGHLLICERTVTPDGRLAPKSETLYLTRTTDGREAWMNARGLAERQAAEPEASWGKVYKWRRGNEWRQLTMAEGAAWDGAKRRGRAPVQKTRYLSPWHDRKENPAWLASSHVAGEDGAATVWRATIALRINEALEAAGEAARVSHLSYKDQGLDKIPTVHEGQAARSIEARARADASVAGVAYEPVTDRARTNAEIIQTNRAIELARRAAALEARRTAAPPRPRQAVPQPQPRQPRPAFQKQQPAALRPQGVTARPAVMRAVLAKARREGRVPDRRGVSILARWLRRHTHTNLGSILAAARLRMDTPAEAVMVVARAVAATVIRAVISRTQRKNQTILAAGRRAVTAWNAANPTSMGGGSSSRSSSSAPSASAPARSHSREISR